MRISITITHYSSPDTPTGLGARLGRIAHTAEEAGLDTVWVPDHLLQVDPSSTPDAAMLETFPVTDLLFSPIVSPTGLLIAVMLAVYKPRDRIRSTKHRR